LEANVTETNSILGPNLIDPAAPGPSLNPALVDQVEQNPALVNTINQNPDFIPLCEENPELPQVIDENPQINNVIVIRISELAGERGLLEGFVFEGCDLKGPAVLVPQGSTFVEANLVGDPDALLWEIPPDRPEVIGAILALNCTFEGCTFMNVGFAGPPSSCSRLGKASARPDKRVRVKGSTRMFSVSRAKLQAPHAERKRDAVDPVRAVPGSRHLGEPMPKGAAVDPGSGRSLECAGRQRSGEK
jgi:hypothetical protein